VVERLVFLCGDVAGFSVSCHGRLEERSSIDNHVGLFGIGLGNKQIGTATTIGSLVQYSVLGVREWSVTRMVRPVSYVNLQGSSYRGPSLSSEQVSHPERFPP